MTTPGPTEGPGAVNWAVQSAILNPESAYRQRVDVILPSVHGIAAALHSVDRVERAGLGLPYGGQQTLASPRTYDRPRWFLSVSPGTVRLHRRLVAPKDALWQDDGMTLLDDRRTRGAISAWSAESRARMFQTLPALDYQPMFDEGRMPALVTLTLPGQEWERLVPNVATFKKAVNRFQRDYRRAWGVMPRAVWKMEFQRRGAPHLHLFMVPPEGLSRGRGAKAGLRFPNWLSIAWADIIDPTRSGAGYVDHVLAGTGIDYREGARFSDPRRIAAYFSKHGAFADKDYQNEMPEHWRAAILEEGGGGGHFWGYWQLEKAIHTIELSSTVQVRPKRSPLDGEPIRHRYAPPPTMGVDGAPEQNRHYDSLPTEPSNDQVTVMRHLRKLAKSRSFIRSVTVPRLRVDLDTGVVKVKMRKVRRRKQYLVGAASGFLVVNDGEAVARDIARLLGAPPLTKSDFKLVA